MTSSTFSPIHPELKKVGSCVLSAFIYPHGYTKEKRRRLFWDWRTRIELLWRDSSWVDHFPHNELYSAREPTSSCPGVLSSTYFIHDIFYFQPSNTSHAFVLISRDQRSEFQLKKLWPQLRYQRGSPLYFLDCSAIYLLELHQAVFTFNASHVSFFFTFISVSTFTKYDC